MMKLVWAAGASFALALLAGCSFAANPQPPTLSLPTPVRDLTANRAGNAVHLHWTMPKNTTDKVVLKGDQRAHICWISGAGTTPGKPSATAAASTGLPNCSTAGDATFPPGKPVDDTVEMPAELVAGASRIVSYYVELQNHAGKTAGPSNPGLIVTGSAPAAVIGFRVTTQAEGVVLHWQSADAQPGMVMRIHRTLIERPGAAKASEGNGTPPTQEQVLEVDLDKSDPGQTLDRDAAFDHQYRYTIERVQRLELERHALEISGVSSSPLTIDAKDIFPPAVPSGVAVVADEQAHALNASWTPDADPDLAGYIVYRRDLTAAGAMERVSGKALVVPPSFEDKNVIAGHRYAYSVSAVDQDGNESARSGEVEEQLPQ